MKVFVIIFFILINLFIQAKEDQDNNNDGPYWKYLTDEEIKGWYDNDIGKSTYSLVVDKNSICTYDANDVSDRTRKDNNGKRYHDYYGCNYCHENNDYTNANDDCFMGVIKNSSPLCHSSQQFIEDKDIFHGNPFGSIKFPRMNKRSFDRKIHNWFAMTPVDSYHKFSNPYDRNFSNSVIKMSRNNQSMVWIGDSTTLGSYGTFTSVLCDLKRVHKENITIEKYKNFGIELHALNNIERQGVSQKFTISIKLNQSDFNNKLIEDNNLMELDIYFLPLQGHYDEEKDLYVRTKLHLIGLKYDGLVIIANLGLHTNPIHEIETANVLKSFLFSLNLVALGNSPLYNSTDLSTFNNKYTIKKNNIVLFRETGAQHFNTENGYFTRRGQTCRPLHSKDDDHDDRDFRNVIVKEIIKDNNYKINIIPFWRYTKHLWDMKKNIDMVNIKINDQQDCTHTGFTIHLAQPILHKIAYYVFNNSNI